MCIRDRSKIGADFIQEDGVWKIWRMRVYPVFQAPYDTCWTDVPPYEGFVAETHCCLLYTSMASG